MDEVADWLVRHGITLGVTLGTVLILLGTGICVLGLNWFLRRVLRGIEARLRLPYETVLTFARVLSSAVWICAALLILNFWGVSVVGLWTVLVSAITVVGVGFLAVWTMVSNVTTSFFITVWRPFRLGQTVELLPESLKGRVVDRNLMFTVLREDDGAALHVPNNLFFQKMFRVTHRESQYLFEFLEGRETHVAAGTPSDGHRFKERHEELRRRPDRDAL
jgi:small-conductance mechanosensitive channel